jgi:hypothetical protein
MTHLAGIVSAISMQTRVDAARDNWNHTQS